MGPGVVGGVYSDFLFCKGISDLLDIEIYTIEDVIIIRCGRVSQPGVSGRYRFPCLEMR